MSNRRPSDFELVDQAKLGEQSAFAELYKRYRLRVHRCCYSFSHEDVEDLTQDSFTRIFLKIGSFRKQSSFGTWVFIVTRNVCLMWKRSRLNHDLQFSVPMEHGDIIPDERNDIEQLESHIFLIPILEGLTSEDRRVLYQRHVLGMTIPEIAKQNQRSKAAVKAHAYRVHLRLQAYGKTH